MSEPADDDFDFDAHIAKLIARRYYLEHSGQQFLFLVSLRIYSVS